MRLRGAVSGLLLAFSAGPDRAARAFQPHRPKRTGTSDARRNGGRALVAQDCPPLLLSAKKSKGKVTGDDDISDVLDEAEAAIREAEEALRWAEQDDIDTEKAVGATEASRIPRQGTVREFNVDAVYGALGGFALGALGGVALNVYLDQSDLGIDIGIDIDVAVLPLLLGVALSAGAYAIGSGEGLPSRVVRAALGWGPKAAGTAVTRKVDETVEEIKATPKKIADSAMAKVDETVEEIKATPGRVVEGTKRAVTKTVDDTKKKVVDTVEEIEETIEKTVAGVVRYPGKKIEEISGKVSDALPKQPPKQPRPPTVDAGAEVARQPPKSAPARVPKTPKGKPPKIPAPPPPKAAQKNAAVKKKEPVPKKQVAVQKTPKTPAAPG